MAIGLQHDRSTSLEGFGYLSLYNLIFILPLVVILLIASDRRLLDTVQNWQRHQRQRMRLWGGALMIALGALIFYF
jgi:cytochrome c biogenesis protein CcdA